MQRLRQSLIAAIVLLVGGFVMTHSALAADSHQADDITQEKAIRYTVTVRNVTGRALANPVFWVAAPVKQTASQQVVELSASSPYRLEADRVGNQTLFFALDYLPPYGSKIVTVRARLKMALQAAPTEQGMAVDDLLAPAPGIESDDGTIIKLAKFLRGANEMATAQAGQSWVASHLKRTTYTGKMLGAVSALNNRSGDCTEFGALLTALYRADQLPARLMAGYVYSGDAILHATDYHNWAEVFIDNKWVVADPHQNNFNNRYADYIAMRVISPSDAVSLSKYSTALSGRFGSSVPGLEMSMY